MTDKYYFRIGSEAKTKKNEINNHNCSHFNLIIDLNWRISIPLLLSGQLSQFECIYVCMRDELFWQGQMRSV